MSPIYNKPAKIALSALHNKNIFFRKRALDFIPLAGMKLTANRDRFNVALT